VLIGAAIRSKWGSQASQFRLAKVDIVPWAKAQRLQPHRM